MWVTMSEDNRPKTVGAVVGEALRAIRTEQGQTQRDAANELAAWGLHWTRAQVASIEAGRRESFTINELMAMSYAYGARLCDWFPGDGRVELMPGVYLPRSVIRDAVNGESFRYPDPVNEFEIVSDEAERKAARNLGITVEEIRDAAERLWMSSFTAEREDRFERIGEGATGKRAAGIRSSISRELMKELRKYLAAKESGDDDGLTHWLHPSRGVRTGENSVTFTNRPRPGEDDEEA